MGDSSDYVVAKKRQTDRVTGASGASARYVPRSDGGADFSIARAADPTVRSDRDVVDNPETNREAGFSISAPLGAAWNHAEIEDAMLSTFAAEVEVSGTDIAAEDAGNILSSATSGKFDTLQTYVGHIVRVAGFTFQAGADNFAVITAVVTGASPELALDSDWFDLEDEAAGEAVTVTKGTDIVPGTTKHWSTFEEEFASDDFQVWYAALCESWALSAPNSDVFTSQFGYRIALRAVSGNGAPAGSSVFTTPSAAPSTPIFSARHLNMFVENAASSSLGLMSWDFQVQNALSPVTPQGVANGGTGASDFAMAKRQISGNASVYNETAAQALITRARAGNPLELAWYVEDDAGDYGYWFYVPKAKYAGATRNPGGDGSPVALSLPWVASKHSTYGFMFLVSYFDLS